jgi:hypothetical protein
MSELLTERAEAAASGQDEAGLEELGRVYKQLNAPVGDFALATLRIATKGAASGSAADDSVYQQTTQLLAALGQVRGDIAGRIETVLEGAWFHGVPADRHEVRVLTEEAAGLIQLAQALATQ